MECVENVWDGRDEAFGECLKREIGNEVSGDGETRDKMFGI
jgi:hypothetical protein